MMKVKWHDTAWDDYANWQEANKKIAKKINKLVKVIRRGGRAGKAELLKGNLSGYMGARINEEHRLVYRIEKDLNGEEVLVVARCKNHY
jgi:toxin YoeB